MTYESYKVRYAYQIEELDSTMKNTNNKTVNITRSNNINKDIGNKQWTYITLKWNYMKESNWTKHLY